MKILVSCHVRWFNAEAFYALTIAKLFAADGHEVCLATHPASPLHDRGGHKLGLDKVWTMDFLSSNPFSWLTGLGTYRRLVREFQPDLITVHRSESFFVTSLALVATGSKPCILRFRGDPRPPRKSVFNRWYYTTQCQALVVTGRKLKTQLGAALKLAEDRISVIYAPVDSQRFRPRPDKEAIRKAWGMPPSGPLLGVVGRIGKVKGHQYLLDTLEQLPLEYRDSHCFIAYHEEHQGVQDLKREVLQRGLDQQVSFVGYNPKLEELMAAADVGIISSIGSEANCRVALEFMSAGIPLVATEVGVIPEIIRPGKTGFLVPAQQPQAAVRAITQLLSDTKLRVKMGQAGRELVEIRFSDQHFLTNVKDLIGQVCPGLTV